MSLLVTYHYFDGKISVTYQNYSEKLFEITNLFAKLNCFKCDPLCLEF